MNGADLRESLIAALHCLLDGKKNIELQIAEAKEVIRHSFEKSEQNGMGPISIEQDAVWYNYLVGSLNQIMGDIDLIRNALSQLGVSVPEFFSSEEYSYEDLCKNQGQNALDFFVEKEK